MSFDPVERMVQSLALYVGVNGLSTERMTTMGIGRDEAGEFAQGVTELLELYPEHGWGNSVVHSLGRYPFVVLQRWRGDQPADTRVAAEVAKAKKGGDEAEEEDGEEDGDEEEDEAEAKAKEAKAKEAEAKEEDVKAKEEEAKETRAARCRAEFPGVHDALLGALPSPSDVILVAVDMNEWLPMHMVDLGAFFRASPRAAAFALINRAGRYVPFPHLIGLMGALGVCPGVTTFESRLPPTPGVDTMILGRLTGLVFPNLHTVTTGVFMGDMSGSAVRDLTLLETVTAFTCPRDLRVLRMDSADPLAVVPEFPPSLATFVNNRAVKDIDALLDALPGTLQCLELRLAPGQAAVVFHRLARFPDLAEVDIRMTDTVTDADLQVFAESPPVGLRRLAWALAAHPERLNDVLRIVSDGPSFPRLEEFVIIFRWSPFDEDDEVDELSLDLARNALHKLPALRFLDGCTFGLCPHIWDIVPDFPLIDTVVHPDKFINLEWDVIRTLSPARIKYVVMPKCEDTHACTPHVALWMFLCLSQHDQTFSELIK